MLSVRAACLRLASVSSALPTAPDDRRSGRALQTSLAVWAPGWSSRN
ncbi:hypothetical protein [Frankia sp. CiP3]|nr:hypothetical protein [Frankia sp. CiP3]